MPFKIEQLDSRKHYRSKFCCGEESLDMYIRKQASQDIKKGVSTVFVLVNNNDLEYCVLAYYSLSAYAIEAQGLDEKLTKRLPKYPRLPATLLGRLAVDNTQKGNRLGKAMLVDALKKALNASEEVSSLGVVAEALNESAVSFYRKYGFQQIKGEPMKLFIPMRSVKDTENLSMNQKQNI